MTSETKQCQSCKAQFTIEPEDFEFYKKMAVPPPTFCPDCRLERRLIWRNERILYKRKCNAPGHTEDIITTYDASYPGPVYDQDFWWSDEWDPLSYGREYDFSRPFFAQLKDLLFSVPTPNVVNLQAVNSDYSNFTWQSKNCYLVFASNLNEDSAYLYHAEKCKNSYDLLGCANNEWCYECIHSPNCYRSAYLFFSANCLNSRFLYNCQNCQDCFGCVNIKNAKYQIFNEQFSKEEYEKKIREMNLGDSRELEASQKKFLELSLRYPRRFAMIIQSVASSGDYLKNTKNSHLCFDCEGSIEDSKWLIYGIPGTKDCFDGYGVGEGAEQVYEATASGGSIQNTLFCCGVWFGHSYQYSVFCRGSSNLFGCFGVRNKEYCILNKQYSKEEYEALLPKIIAHMNAQPYVDQKGRVFKYGEFFPAEIAPFSYNETIAQEYTPLTREEAEKKGYKWKEMDKKAYAITKTSQELPINIKDVSDSILGEVIGCAHEGQCYHQCTTAFKVIPTELEFYKQMNIPLPRLCANCRHYERLAKRNPFKLWKRTCQCVGEKSENNIYTNTASHFHKKERCLNSFETSYASDRPEIVYCEQCYQAEVA